MGLRISLSNDFHDTVTEVLAKFTTEPDIYTISPLQAKRAKRKLCGIKDCTCGGVAGERGPQPYNVEDDGDIIYLVS